MWNGRRLQPTTGPAKRPSFPAYPDPNKEYPSKRPAPERQPVITDAARRYNIAKKTGQRATNLAWTNYRATLLLAAAGSWTYGQLRARFSGQETRTVLYLRTLRNRRIKRQYIRIQGYKQNKRYRYKRRRKYATFQKKTKRW